MESKPVAAPADPAGAPTVTTVIAGNVRRLRKELRLSGAALAALMNRGGVPWTRTTVAKLETSRRDAVSVQELLALAVALRVPPVWLLVDPGASSGPIASGVRSDPWAALLWLVGKEPLEDPAGGQWEVAAGAISQAWQVASLVQRFRDLRAHAAIASAVLDEPGSLHDDDDERRVLRSLAAPLRRLCDWSFGLPALPDDVRARAADLGVDICDTIGGSLSDPLTMSRDAVRSPS